jgi:hypothetical protein
LLAVRVHRAKVVAPSPRKPHPSQRTTQVNLGSRAAPVEAVRVAATVPLPLKAALPVRKSELLFKDHLSKQLVMQIDMLRRNVRVIT